MKKNVSNLFWLVSEKGISFLGTLLVTSQLANYIGKELFGIISFATIVFTIAANTSWLGGVDYVISLSSKSLPDGVKSFNRTIKIRVLAYSVICIPILIYFYSKYGTYGLIFGTSAVVSLFFLIIDKWSILINASLNSKLNVLANLFGLASALMFRYLIVYFSLNPAATVIPIVCINLIPFILRPTIVKLMRCELWVRHKEDLNDAREFEFSEYWRNSSGLLYSGILIIVYTQVPGALLAGNNIGEYAVFSVASFIGTSWSFLGVAISNSFLPTIYAEKDKRSLFSLIIKVSILIIICSVSISLLVYLLGEFIIKATYGQDYASALPSSIVLAIATGISCLGYFLSRVISFLGYSSVLLYRSFCVVVLFLPICMWLNGGGSLGASLSIFSAEIISLAFSIIALSFISRK